MPHTLLLADDSKTIQRVVTLMFSDEDITVVPVNDGDAAIEALDRVRPDVVLADVDMPGPDGYALAEFIREQGGGQSVPVLLMAGAFDQVDESRAAACGATGVLTKPFDPRSMIARIKAVIAASEAGLPVPFTVEAPPTLAVDLLPVEPLPVLPVPDGAAALPIEEPPQDVAAATEEAPTEPPQEDVVPAASAYVSASQAAPEAEAGPVGRADVDASGDVPSEAPPQELAPADAPPEHLTEVDRYFEQLDAQFAALTQHPRPVLVPPPAPAAAQTPDDTASVAPGVTSQAEGPDAVPADAGEGLDGAPAQAAATDTRPPVLPLTDAFAALLDAEQAGAAPPAIRPAAMPVLNAAGVDVEALAEQVAKRVLARLSDRVIRETVAEIVAATAERVVREEIDRIKRNIT